MMHCRFKMEPNARVYRHSKCKKPCATFTTDRWVYSDFNIDRMFHLMDYDVWVKYEDIGGMIRLLGKHLSALEQSVGNKEFSELVKEWRELHKDCMCEECA